MKLSHSNTDKEKTSKLYSICDLINLDDELIKDKIFIVLKKNKEKYKLGIQYVQIKRTNYIKHHGVHPSSKSHSN